MMEQVSEIDKKKRVKKLMELSSRQEKEYYDTFIFFKTKSLPA